MMLNVVGLFPSFGSGITGGIEASAEIAWEALSEYANSNQQNPYLLCYGNVPQGSFDSPAMFFTSTKRGALRKAIDPRLRPKLVFVWHLGMLKLVPAFLPYRPKIVVFLHGIEAWRRQDRLTRYLFDHVELFLSNSVYTWKRFVHYQPHLGTRSHIVTPLGYGASPDEDTLQPDTRPKLLMVSRLSLTEDYKGHREIISVWPEVLKRIPDAELIIAGEGNLRPILEQMVDKMKIGQSVTFLGFVSEENKRRLFAQCTAFAMPSRNEGFGLVYLEAMRVGRPCLVSNQDAGREVVNPPECGLDVDVKDSKSLVNAICRLLMRGPEWDTWSLSARNRYENAFKRDQFKSRILAALSTINA